MKKSIEKINSKRIIVGFLGELSFQGVPVKKVKTEQSFIPNLNLDSSDLGKSTLSLKNKTGEIKEESLILSCILNDKVIEFEVKKIKENNFTLPPELTISNQRQSKRHKIRRCATLMAEIKFKNKIFISKILNLNAEAILVSTPDIPLPSPNEHGSINVYNTKTLESIFYSFVQISNTREDPDHLLLRITDKRLNKSGKYKRKRVQVKMGSLVMITSEGHPCKNKISINLHDASLTGFSGEVINKVTGSEIHQGEIYHLENIEVKARIEKVNGTQLACSILYPSKSERTESWIKFVQNIFASNYTDAIPKDEIKSILTEGYFLKGLRRGFFSKENDESIFDTFDNHDPMLFSRVGVTTESSELSLFGSWFRFTDHCWNIQEGVTNSRNEISYSDFEAEVINRLATLSKIETMFPRYILSMMSYTVKNNVSRWIEKFKDDDSKRFYFSKHISFSVERFKDIEFFPDFFKTSRHQDFSTDDLINFSRFFDPFLLQIIDYFSLSLPNRILNHLLNSKGPDQQANIYITTDNNHNPLAVIYKVNTLYTYNVSGLINTIFVFPASNLEVRHIPSLVNHLNSFTELSLGTSDFQIILKEDCEIEGANSFFWFFMDLLNV